ncbi:MAG: hypothetical protein CL920_01245 [Deltaproteobacteria bacterium]|nr:hypothetical protein [Deltaproteobacteria bacterium]MBU47306.1 hypothetical protein [Deltaproteobacteria bacterium]|tara:strand:+ start:8348 stop:9268 length:921 start_codon:yes stop_codon:yes gene_type:complete
MLYIHGYGFCSADDEGMQEGTAMLPSLPAKEYIPRRQRRRMGRLAQLYYIAASKALTDAGVSQPFTGPMISGTGYGEISIAISFLRDMFTYRGRDLSPTAIQNSVHNAPLSHASIGLANTAPALTVSQGWLSVEAALQTAMQLSFLVQPTHILVLCGDVFDAQWLEELRERGYEEQAAKLDALHLREGAAAMVLSPTPPDEERYGVCREAMVCHQSWQDAWKHRVFGEIDARGSVLRLRALAEGVRLAREVEDKDWSAVVCDENGWGTSAVGAIHQLQDCATRDAWESVLLLGTEHGDIGGIHWSR